MKANLQFKPRSVLIVKLGSIGDVVNSLPLANALKDSRPDLRLGWLVEPKSLPVIEDHDAVDEVIVFRRELGLSGVGRALREIRLFRPDLVVDLQRILRSGFFTFFSGCRYRLGFNRGRCKEMSWLFYNRRIPAADSGEHMVTQYLEFASYLGLPETEAVFKLPIGESERARATRLLPPAALKGEIICLNLGATKPANRWPDGHWARLADLLASRDDTTVVLTGGEGDVAAARSVLAESRSAEALVDLAGRTTLKELGGLYDLAAAVVSSDSGPMHIASALGTRTIGLFGPSSPRRTGPWNHLQLVVRSGEECSPCGKRRCRRDDCMSAIPPEEVFRRLTAPEEEGGGDRKDG